MRYLFSVSSALLVLASLLLTSAFLLPRWAQTPTLGGGSLGIWQMFVCTPLINISADIYAMRAFAVLAMLSTLVAVAALVAHVTVVRVEKRKASLRTFTIAAYLTVAFTLLIIITFASVHGREPSFLSYSFGLTLLGTILMSIAAFLGTWKASMF